MDKTSFMRRAIALSRTSADRPGTRPFAAVVVKDGKVVGEGLNQAAAKCDPTSHGEIEAIRDACRTLGTTDLAGCELYASCEPCIMCAAAMYRAGIGRLYYGVSLEQSAALLPVPFKSTDVARQLTRPVGKRDLPAEQMMADEACEVLRQWGEDRAGDQ